MDSTYLAEYRHIPEYEGLYLAGSDGYIIGLQRIERRISEYKTKRGGYLRICLTKNGKKKQKLVHRLVARTFIPNPSKKPQINHKNGIKTDNRVENLEWCTASENKQHSWDIGTSRPGKPRGGKLSKGQVLEIIKRGENGENQRKIANRFGVNQSLVSRIISRESRKIL